MSGARTPSVADWCAKAKRTQSRHCITCANKAATKATAEFVALVKAGKTTISYRQFWTEFLVEQHDLQVGYTAWLRHVHICVLGERR